MLITFRSQAYADITMFGDVAVSLLQMMGHSGAVPGAILAEDIPAALERLKKAIATDRGAVADAAGKAQDEDEDSGERPVSLAHHAFPLLELLTAAAARKCDVMWVRTA